MNKYNLHTTIKKETHEKLKQMALINDLDVNKIIDIIVKKQKKLVLI